MPAAKRSSPGAWRGSRTKHPQARPSPGSSRRPHNLRESPMTRILAGAALAALALFLQAPEPARGPRRNQDAAGLLKAIAKYAPAGARRPPGDALHQAITDLSPSTLDPRRA